MSISFAKSVLREPLVQGVLVVLVVIGAYTAWDRTTYPPPGPALAPQIVAHMGASEWRVVGPGGERRVLPQDGMLWAGTFTCDRWSDPNRSGSAKNRGNRQAPTFQCIIGITEPSGDTYPVVLRVAYVAARSQRRAEELFGYALPPDIPGFHLYLTDWEEAIKVLGKADLRP
ncbi:MAG: hypothetical protein ACRC14_12015 [Paracoccaceae bacterium]